MKNKINLFEPSIDLKEEYITKKILNSKFWASGSGTGYVNIFESNFNKYVNSKQCIAVNSGTAALHLALSLFDIKNKEVILPSLSFVSTAHAIIYNGGKPVFVDIDSKNLCLDPTEIEKSITKKTKVIIPVHFGGMPCNLEKISQICKKNKIAMIEDAAHAAGSIFNKKPIGSHGDCVCFSFHPVKNLSMPTGGAITLNSNKSKKFSQILKSLRWCGISNRVKSKYDVPQLGWNYYMNEISAGIGLVQLKKLKKLNTIRKKIAKQYSQKLIVKNKMEYNSNCSYHLYWIRVKKRDTFMKKMNDNNIETGIHYFPIHKMSFYKSKLKLPITEKITKEIVSLPIHPNLSDDEVSKIIKLTNSFS
jgi:perosamine synthetase